MKQKPRAQESEQWSPSPDASMMDYALILVLKKLGIRSPLITWAVWATEKTDMQKPLLDFLLKHQTLTEDELLAEMHRLIPEGSEDQAL